MLINTTSEPSKDGTWWVMVAGNQASPTQSYYMWCKQVPSRLLFGINGRAPQYVVSPA